MKFAINDMCQWRGCTGFMKSRVCVWRRGRGVAEYESYYPLKLEDNTDDISPLLNLLTLNKTCSSTTAILLWCRYCFDLLGRNIQNIVHGLQDGISNLSAHNRRWMIYSKVYFLLVQNMATKNQWENSFAELKTLHNFKAEHSLPSSWVGNSLLESEKKCTANDHMMKYWFCALKEISTERIRRFPLPLLKVPASKWTGSWRK